jgi:hypothetical protein
LYILIECFFFGGERGRGLNYCSFESFLCGTV